MNAIVKANAGTFQTMLVGYMGDMDITTNDGATMSVEHALGDSALPMIENMVNPYDNTQPVYRFSAPGDSIFDPADDAWKGMADVVMEDTNILYVNGRGRDGELLLLPNSLPANKY